MATVLANNDFTTDLGSREQEFVAAIQGPIPPVKTPLTYRLAMLLAAVVMIVLPLIYVALAFVFAYIVYFHAVNSIGMFEHVSGRGVILALIAYLAPLIAGVTAVFFMFKPLFSRAPKRDEPTTLTRKDEPVLFTFVDRLCDSVHAPRPRQINVDCQVNASASFRRGSLSMLLGNDLTLTIGLPLAGNMSLRQLAGILAHEFGHFAQGGGMRLSYVVRTISHWFTRVVYERDEWDVNLKRWSEENDIRIGVIFYLARGCVWLTRKVLWVLMMIGNGVSGLLLRQMEFDADRHEVRFSGSDVIEPTTRRLHELMVAHEMACNDLSHAMSEGRLADNIISLIAANAEDLPDEIDKHIDTTITEGSTGWLDTHPCDRERIASGLKEQAPGVFHLDLPATQLFADFGAVCKRATTSMYEAALGSDFKPGNVRPAHEILVVAQARKNSAKALDKFMLKGWSSLAPIKLSKSAVPTPEDDLPVLVAKIQKLRSRMLTDSGGQAGIVKEMGEFDSILSECAQAGVLLQGAVQFKPDTFSRNLTSTRLVTETSDSYNAAIAAKANDYKLFLAVATDRLWNSLSILHMADQGTRIPDADSLLRECDDCLLPALHKLLALRIRVMKLRAEFDCFSICLQVLSGGVEAPELFGQLEKSRTQCRKLLTDIQDSSREDPYPFEHAKSDMTVGRFLVERVPRRDDFGGLFETMSTALEGFGELYVRCFGRLCEIAMLVEDHVLEENDSPAE